MSIIFPILTVLLFTITFNGFRTFISLSLCELKYPSQEISAVLSSISVGLFMATIFFRNIISNLGIYRTFAVSISIMLTSMSIQIFLTNIKIIAITNFIFSFFANIAMLCITDIFFVYSRSFFDTYYGICQSIGRLSSFFLFFMLPVSLTPLHIYTHIFIMLLVGALLFFNFTTVKASIVKEEIGRADTVRIMIHYFKYFATISICNISDSVISGFMIFSLKYLNLTDHNIILIIFLFNTGKLVSNLLFDLAMKILSVFMTMFFCSIGLVIINSLILIYVFDILGLNNVPFELKHLIYLSVFIFLLGYLLNCIRISSLRYIKKIKTSEHKDISAQQTHTQIENLTAIIGVGVGMLIIKLSPSYGIFLGAGSFGVLLILTLVLI